MNEDQSKQQQLIISIIIKRMNLKKNKISS